MFYFGCNSYLFTIEIQERFLFKYHVKVFEISHKHHACQTITLQKSLSSIKFNSIQQNINSTLLSGMQH